MGDKKVIDYWDDYDPTEFDPAKRPTSIIKTSDNILAERKIVNNVERNDDYETYSYYNSKLNNGTKQKEFNDNYDELADEDNDLLKLQKRPSTEVEINQSEELNDLDELNLHNDNRFIPVEENDAIAPVLDVNEMHSRWQNSKVNLITRKLDVLRNRAQEPRLEERPKYSFLVPDSLEELLKKPKEVVIDATPHVGGDEIFPEKKYFNNSTLIDQVKGEEAIQNFNNDNNLNEDSIKPIVLDEFDDEKIIVEENYDDLVEISKETPIVGQPSMASLLRHARKNIDDSKKEAIFIKNEDILDPDNLTYEQRIRLLKLASDPNNEERKMLLQMKLNNGSLTSLSAIVKERLKKINSGEVELVEDQKENNGTKGEF